MELFGHWTLDTAHWCPSQPTPQHSSRMSTRCASAAFRRRSESDKECCLWPWRARGSTAGSSTPLHCLDLWLSPTHHGLSNKLARPRSGACQQGHAPRQARGKAGRQWCRPAGRGAQLGMARRGYAYTVGTVGLVGAALAMAHHHKRCSTHRRHPTTLSRWAP